MRPVDNHNHRLVITRFTLQSTQQMRLAGIERIPTSGLSHTHRHTELLKS